MKKNLLFLLTILLVACTPAQPPKLGIQTYTFHRFTLMETLGKSQQLGLHYAEAYFGQRLGTGFADSLHLDYSLDSPTRTKLKQAFERHGIQLYSLGVAVYSTEQDWKRFFEFAHDMGVKAVSCEPLLEQLDFIEQLAQQHNIEVAIHNHPAPSIYADPAVLAKALEGRSALMGVCADIGHWKRVGKDPIAALQLLKGRLKIMHFKDIDNQLEDTVWGTGILEIGKVVKELKSQAFSGKI